ncbi:MAG: NusG domain II-containing protein [Lachnospiraceae bacterium]|nr:NusG domain II-containing protein [Lachnospiraceae bacterium]
MTQEDKLFKLRRADLVVGAVILAAALVLFLVFRIAAPEGGVVTVTVRGEVMGTYHLDEPLEVDIVTDGGDVNHLSINGGKATVTDADCPDKLCVHQPSISRKGEMIVCLPHGLVIEITEGRSGSFDAVAS